MDHGLDLPLLVRQAAQFRVGAFAWLPVVGTCTVGVSLGLSLFLLLREIRLEQDMEK